jgi:hypothetical protein
MQQEAVNTPSKGRIAAAGGVGREEIGRVQGHGDNNSIAIAKRGERNGNNGRASEQKQSRSRSLRSLFGFWFGNVAFSYLVGVVCSLSTLRFVGRETPKPTSLNGKVCAPINNGSSNFISSYDGTVTGVFSNQFFFK